MGIMRLHGGLPVHAAVCLALPHEVEGRIVEAIWVNPHPYVDDQSRLHLQMTVTDPATFTGPAIIELDWVALGRTIQKYDCRIF